MVHYIRFLKPPTCVPKHSGREFLIKSVITVTTDLGDDFYNDTSILEAQLRRQEGRVQLTVESRELPWHAGARAIPIEFLIRPRAGVVLQLHVSHKSNCDGALTMSRMPEFVGAISDKFRPTEQANQSLMVCRTLSLEPFPELLIWEESGESIARHIWDAALGLVAFIREQFSASDDIQESRFKTLFTQSNRKLNVIELGSGCGIVGIALAQMASNCDILLTDLPEADETLKTNIKQATLAQRTTLSSTILNWDDTLPQAAKKSFDLILISDCTYNNDSSPALVRILRTLSDQSEDVTILVSMKVRHSSEAVFFDLMDDNGFEQSEQHTVVLPDRSREQFGQDLEQIEIYSFRNRV